MPEKSRTHWQSLEERCVTTRKSWPHFRRHSCVCKSQIFLQRVQGPGHFCAVCVSQRPESEYLIEQAELGQQRPLNSRQASCRAESYFTSLLLIRATTWIKVMRRTTEKAMGRTIVVERTAVCSMRRSCLREVAECCWDPGLKDAIAQFQFIPSQSGVSLTSRRKGYITSLQFGLRHFDPNTLMSESVQDCSYCRS